MNVWRNGAKCREARLQAWREPAYNQVAIETRIGREVTVIALSDAELDHLIRELEDARKACWGEVPLGS